MISERTIAGLDAIAREGRPRSRFIPYGWRTARGGIKAVRGDRAPLVKHPEEQRALRRMIRLREKGEGPQAIADRLNAAGLRTRVGKPWNRHVVWKILERHEDREEARAETA